MTALEEASALEGAAIEETEETVDFGALATGSVDDLDRALHEDAIVPSTPSTPSTPRNRRGAITRLIESRSNATVES